MIRTLATALATTTCLVALATPAAAQTREFNVPAGSLRAALDTFARQSGRQVIYRGDEVRSAKSPGVRGARTAEDALEALLAGTGFAAKKDASGAFAVVKVGNAPATAETASSTGEAIAGNAAADGESADIVVTGTHLRGTPLASPVITLSQKDMRDSGQTSLAQAIQSLPENFGGGQNPNVGLGIPGAQNSSGASTINLRGIGGDATLTLLNGHRLSYNANLQSIDISSIPFLAIDRVEIVPDGASALYGSDAVAGVANIILKHDYNGVISDVRIGGATDGGDFQQQYALLAGTRWASGGIAASYEYNRETAIDASDRAYARGRSPGLNLQPYLKHHDGTLTLHQDITPDLIFSLDMVGNTRWNLNHYAVDNQGNYLLNGGEVRSRSNSFVVSPSLSWTIGRGWSANLTGMLGSDHNHYTLTSYVNRAVIATTDFCNCNAASSIEFSTNGSVLDLPGGPLKIALGAGYRTNRFIQTDMNLRASDGITYGYGETEIPIVSSLNEHRFLRQLSLSGAVRYESYRNGTGVATPKLGIIYAPARDIVFRASWGQSFKAPTLFQRYDAVRVGLFPVALLGGSGASATAFNLIGGSPDLKPERSTSWSAGFKWKPSMVHGLEIEASYFNVDYRNRVVTPITYQTQALSAPQYADFVHFDPTAGQIADALALGQFVNVTGKPYNPASVIAIVDNRYVNAGHQQLQGVDMAVRYSVTTGRSQLNFTGSASYLDSHQQLSAEQPVRALAGTLYNPPHFRARAGVVWTAKTVTLSSFANYIGGVRDVRSVPALRVASMTTLDMAGRYTPQLRSPVLGGLELSLSIQNLLNRKPSLITGTTIYEQPYDATNYSAVGRLISFGITKHW